MVKYVIHAGPHKTGSTYLQLCFNACSQALAEKGVLYPRIWQHSPGVPSHFGLVQRLKRGEFGALADERRALVTADVRTVLISSEDISTLDEQALHGLRECLDSADIQFVFYLRRWSELVPSSWQEIVKGGNTMTLPEFVLMQLRNPEATSLLNWERRLAGPIAAFGRDAIRLVAFSHLRRKEIDIFTHFAQRFLDWWGAIPPALPPSNPSRDADEIALLRAINVIAASDAMEVSSLLRNRFDQRRTALSVEPVLASMAAHRRTIMFHDELPSLRALHQTLFDTLQDRVVEPRMPHRLFRPEGAVLPYVSGDFLVEPGMADAVRAIYETLKAD